MQTRPEPRFEATVSSLLIELLSAGSRPVAEAGEAGETNGSASDPGLAVDEMPADDTTTEPVRPFPGEPIRLRVDGCRPLRFSGALLWEDHAEVPLAESVNGSLHRHLRLFARQDGAVVAQVSFVPQEGLAARPVHRAREITHPDDLDRFVKSNSPEDCFAVAPQAWASASPTARSTDAMRGSSRTAPLFLSLTAEPEGTMP